MKRLFKDILPAIGGILILLLFPLVISLFWFDLVFVAKLIATDIVLLSFVYFVEKVYDSTY